MSNGRMKPQNSQKNAAKGLAPKLRFPEFRDVGEWVVTTIGDIGTFYYGKSAPKWSLEENAPTPCVRYGELYTKYDATITETYSRTNIEPKNLRFSKGGEILVPRVGERPEDFGKCCSYLTLENIAIGEMISVFETEQNPLFYTYYFRNLYAQFAKVVEGQNVKNLYYAELEPLRIYLPTLNEQQKIADCLSSIDALITAHSEKLDALKAHKKGLMQQLFPREGETVPRCRFLEYRDAGEWEEKPLKKIFSIFQGFAFSSKDSANNGVRWLKIADVGIQQMNSRTPSFLPLSHNQEYKRFVVYLGDYVVALTRPILSGKLKTSKVDEVYDGALLNQRVGKLVTDQNIDFVYCLLQTSQLISNIEKNIAGNDPPNLSSQQIGDIIVRIPLGGEQQEIADCLSSIDALITTQTKKLDTLKTLKKGLMQQLFPSPDDDCRDAGVRVTQDAKPEVGT